MERLHIPWMFFGPTGSGKLTLARNWIEQAYKKTLSIPLEERKFSIGDGYEAKVKTSPFHFEIDIPNLSMQDKQIIGDLLSTFFSSADVLTSLHVSTRKLVILRRAHSLSLPAAIRVRSILQQYVLPPDAAGMIWITAREMTGPLSILEDCFARHTVPRTPFHDWCTLEIPDSLKTIEAWDRCHGQHQRAKDVLVFFPTGNIPRWPRRVQDYYDEMIEQLIYKARSGKSPTLAIILWIRKCIYQALSLCQTGPEIVDSFANGIEHNFELLEPSVFWKCMHSLALSEPHTSYRTPLALEAALLNLYEVVRQHSSVLEKPPTITNECSIVDTPTHVSSDEQTAIQTVKSKPVVKRRSAPRKKTNPT